MKAVFEEMGRQCMAMLSPLQSVPPNVRACVLYTMWRDECLKQAGGDGAAAAAISIIIANLAEQPGGEEMAAQLFDDSPDAKAAAALLDGMRLGAPPVQR